MNLRLEKVVPWGRSLQEYQAMFGLTDTDLQRRILDCGGGPASFNAEMHQLGHTVISCDPIYQFSAADIHQRVVESAPAVLQGVQATQQNFVWRQIRSPEHLIEIRLTAMRQFLADFPTGLEQGRYLNIALPHLPFADQAFDLALCSHLLFTYSDQLSLEFHLAAIQEMLRVASEVRLFPLLVNMTGEISPHLATIWQHFQDADCQVTIETVSYEFQRGGNQLLKIIALEKNHRA